MNDDESKRPEDKRPAKPSDPWTESPPVLSASGKTGASGKKKGMDEGEWERDVISKLAFSAIKEQRRTRRWGIFFKVLLFAYLFAILFYFPSWDSQSISPGPHTGLVELRGVIADDAEANADRLVTGLRAAFEEKNTKGVILRINSPGGSPVQAGYVYDEIVRLRDEYPDKKLYAVVTDVCASGGYYVAAAADEIYANEASLVGSIGVIMGGFGFVDAIDKLGVERRLMTAGEHKALMDPFSELKEEEVEHVQTMLDNIHEQFIAAVKKGRGDRLKDNPDLFSGLFWTGEESVELGLVDGLGSSGYVAREIIQAEKIVNYTPRGNPLDRLAEQFGMAIGKGVSRMMDLKSLQLQ